MELKMIDMKDIVTNPLQPRQDFNRDKLQELANSIKEGELLQPIVVRKNNGGKFDIVCGERRYKAFQILKEPKIPAIVREIKDDTEALEKSLIENLQRDDLTSVERENAVYELWKSGNYKTGAELSRKLGIDNSYVSDLLLAKGERDRLSVPPTISTDVLKKTRGLSDEPRKKIIENISEGKIKSRAEDLSRTVKKLKEFPEPEQQMEILEEFEQQEEQSKEIFNGIIEKQRRIAKQEIEPEHFKDNSADMIRLEAIKDIYNRSSSFTSFYINRIESSKEKNEAIQYIKKIVIHWNKVLIALDEVKVIDIAK